jgi:hypothetical protein
VLFVEKGSGDNVFVVEDADPADCVIVAGELGAIAKERVMVTVWPWETICSTRAGGVPFVAAEVEPKPSYAP